MADIAYQYRGELVDQVHGGHIAVTDHTGRLLWKLGDPERLTFARSSAKPIQAVPVAESGALEHYCITQRELVLNDDCTLTVSSRPGTPILPDLEKMAPKVVASAKF